MESARAWVGRMAERAWRAPGTSSVGGRIGGGGGLGELLRAKWFCARESGLSVSMLGNCVVALRMHRSTDVSATQNRLLT